MQDNDIELVWPTKKQSRSKMQRIEFKAVPGTTSYWQTISPNKPPSPLQTIHTVTAYRIVLKDSKKYFPGFKDDEMKAYYTESFDDIAKKYKQSIKQNPIFIEEVVIEKDTKGNLFRFRHVEKIIELENDVVLITVYRIIYKSKNEIETAYQLTISPGIFSIDKYCNYIYHEEDLKSAEEFLQECIKAYNYQSCLNNHFKPPIIEKLKLDWLEHSHIFDDYKGN